MYCVQHLEYHTGCLKPSVAILTGNHKSGLSVHSASYILAMCGKFNGYVYDVQHLEYHTGCNCLKPFVAFRVHGSFDVLW